MSDLRVKSAATQWQKKRWFAASLPACFHALARHEGSPLIHVAAGNPARVLRCLRGVAS